MRTCALFFAGLIVAAFWADGAWAQSCTYYAITGIGPHGTDNFYGATPAAACTAAGAGEGTTGTYDAGTNTCSFAYGGGVGVIGPNTGSGPPQCPVQHCTPVPGVTNSFSGTSTSVATRSYCNTVTDCQVNVTQSVAVNGTVIYTGVESQTQDCASGTPAVPSGSASPAAPQCATGASGMTYCTNPTGGANCGEINGQFVCLGNIPQGGCAALAGGDKACDAKAGTPPAPDSGTPGVPATPSDTINTPGTSGMPPVVNYFNQATVSGSSAAGNTGAPGGTPNPTSQAAQGQGTGWGTAVGSAGPSAGNGDCGASGVDCSADGSTPTLPDQRSIGDEATSYFSALHSVPIVAAVSGIAASVPTGACPTATFSVLGTAFTLDEQCTMFEQIQPLLSAVFLAMWALLGVKILMSA